MTKDVFLAEIASILEVEPDEISMDSDFRESADFWSSLTGFALIVFIEENFGKNVDVETFLTLTTVKDLYTVAQGE